MKIRTLLILLIILAILAAMGTLIIRMKGPGQPEEVLGSPLLGQLPANMIMSITVQGPEGSVSLAKRKDLWVVTDRFGYPADFSKIAGLVRQFKEVKIGRAFEPSEDTLKRLSLKDPGNPDTPDGEKGIRVLMKDEKGSLLASILLGKTRMSGTERPFPDGQYVMLGQEPKTYLIDKHFASLETKPSAWMNKNLAKVEATEVKRISCLSPDRNKVWYTFERPEKGKDLEALNLPADSKVQKSVLNRLAGGLSALRMEDVLDPSKPPESIGLEPSAWLEYHLFDGTIYRLFPGKTAQEADRFYLKLEVDYQKPTPAKDEGSKDEASEEKTGSEKGPEEYALDAKQLNARLSPWVYLIPKWQHSAFITDLNQILERPEKDKEKKKE